MNRFRLFTRLILLIFISFFISGCGKNKNAPLYNALPINTDGNPTGKIVLVEFLDYSDPTCIKMARIINEVMEQRPNVRIIYHPIALNQKKDYYTEMVLAAGLQDRFLAAHHLMINNTANLTKKQAVSLLSQAFIDTDELVQQAAGPQIAAMMTANNKLAATWQVTIVPTFFIGRLNHKPLMLVGPQTLPQLLAVIDEEASK